jgi:hypothetical protein
MLGCTESEYGDSQARDPVEFPQQQTSPGADDIPRDDLTDERVLDWTRSESLTETTIRVHFLAGTRECYGTRNVVDESSDTIKIALIEGSLPGAPNACPLVAREASMIVTTSRPITGREILNLDTPELK